MANEKTLKKITLHPISNGQQDDSVDLLSKTSVNNILSGSIDTGGAIPFDAGFTKDLKYDSVQKEIIIPAEIVDGQEYTLPTQYDLSKINIPEDENTIYEDNENRILIGTFKSDLFKVIWVNIDENYPYYSTSTNQWVVDTRGSELPYTDPITFTYDETCLNETYRDLFTAVLGLEPTIEHITVERTIEEKNADIKNWEYSQETHTEIIPALTTGTEYKFNFNVDSYIDILVPQLQVLDYGSTDFNDTHINSAACVYNTIHLETYNGDYYTFFFDLLDETVHGYWADASGSDAHKYTPEELENITFKYYAAGLQTYSGTLVTSEDIIKTIFTNLDGSAITELVDETTYKFNPNVSEYKDLFIELDRNGSYVYNYSMADSTFKNIQIWTYNYYATPFFFNNGNSYYLIPRIDAAYPGTWGSTSSYWDNSHHVYTPEELEDITFVFDRNKIDGSGSLHVLPIDGRLEDLSTNEVTSESLLHRLLLNLDDTPIADDQEEEVTVITTMDQKMNEPLKTKIYDSFAKEIDVVDPIKTGEEYIFKDNMGFTFNDMSLFDGLGTIYEDNENNISITYYGEGGKGWSHLVIDCFDGEDNYIYEVKDTWNNVMTNQWNYEKPNPIIVDENCIVDKILFERMIELSTHKETIIENQTMEQKIADLKNWNYDYKVGLYDVPKWDNILNDFYGTIYYDDDNYVSIRVDTEDNQKSVFIMLGDSPLTSTQYSICNITLSYEITFKADTWYTYSIKQELPVECEVPTLILDEKYIVPDSEYESIDIKKIFDAIYGNIKITLDEKLNEPLKDKTYDKIPQELKNGQTYTLSDNYDAFFEKYAEGETTLFYGNVSNIVDNGSSGETVLHNVISTNSSDSSNSDTRGEVLLDGDTIPVSAAPTIIAIGLITSIPANDKEVELDSGISTRDGAKIDNIESSMVEEDEVYLQMLTSAGILTFPQDGTSWLYEGREIPLSQLPTLTLDTTLIQDEEMFKDFLQLQDKNQTLAEKFKEVESKIGSTVDTTPLKDKIYDNTIELENGQEYTVESDMSNFFERYKEAEYTLIYGASSGGGGAMPVGDEYYQASPKSLTKAPAMDYNDDPEQETIIEISYITTISPKDEMIKAGGLGEASILIKTSWYNYYRYFATGDSWINDDTGNPVSIANMPKLVLNTQYIQNFEMLTNVLHTVPQTLEAKLSEGIANWNYKLGEIKSAPDYAPLFDPSEIILANEEEFEDAGLFYNNPYEVVLYASEDVYIKYSYNMYVSDVATMYFEYGINFEEYPGITYVFKYTLPLNNPSQATWTSTASGTGVVAPINPVYSQEELALIPNYSLSNIKVGYESIVPLLLTEIYNREPNTTLEQKLADIKNWEYEVTPTDTEINQIIDWSQIDTINYDTNLYYDDSRSYYNTLVIKAYNSSEQSAGNCIVFTDATLANAGKGPELEYRNYRNTYTNSVTHSTAEAGKWYLCESVTDPVGWSHAVKFTEVTPSFEFDSQFINSDTIELYNLIVTTINGKEYKVKDKIDEILKNKAYDTILQERLVKDTVYNLKNELETDTGAELVNLGANCAEIPTTSSNVYTYTCLIDGYIFNTYNTGNWYYLDESNTWKPIKTINIINGNSNITDYNKRISYDSIHVFDDKTYLFQGWSGIPCYDTDGNQMYFEVEFDPIDSIITLTGHTLAITGTLVDDHIYASNLFEFNNTLLYMDLNSAQRTIFEIDLENDTATSGIYKLYKYSYDGTSRGDLFENTQTPTGYVKAGKHIITDINGMSITNDDAVNYYNLNDYCWTFKVRHATSTEVADYPDLHLSETYSIIYELVDPSSKRCAPNSDFSYLYNSRVMQGRFTYVANGTTYLVGLFSTTVSYDTLDQYPYVFDTSTNRWKYLTITNPTEARIISPKNIEGYNFIFNPRTQETYYIVRPDYVYKITGIENNKLNFERVEIHGAGDIYYNKNATENEVARLSCEYSADANSYIVKLHINHDGEDIPIAYCDGSDYWKSIYDNQQIDPSPLTVQNSKKYLNYYVDSRIVEIVANLAIPTPVPLEEAINSISQFPACPTDTDGTYVLEATVSSGEITYAWVLKSS